DSLQELRVVLVGNEVPDASVQVAQHKMGNYKLEHLKLSVLQGMKGQNQMSIQTLRSLVMEDFYKNSEERLVSQTMQIDSLRKKLGNYQREEVLSKEILPEIKLLFPHVAAISLSNSLQYNIDNTQIDTLHFALVKFRTQEHPDKEIQTKLELWLKTRLQVTNINLIEQYPAEIQKE
ncbi:MAG: TIGR00341 family protein, partial [Bacteroidaceae bacterium]